VDLVIKDTYTGCPAVLSGGVEEHISSLGISEQDFTGEALYIVSIDHWQQLRNGVSPQSGFLRPSDGLHIAPAHDYSADATWHLFRCVLVTRDSGI
jgi:hypothetical protein